MRTYLKQSLLGAVICALAISGTSQVLVNDAFDYANLAGLQANWGTGTALSLELLRGNPFPAGAHSGTNQVHSWRGSTLNVTPTAASPVILTADIWSSGAAGQRNTVGFRTGASPLFEMGMYNAFDNDVNGPLSPSGTGIGIRVLNMAGGADLSGQRWVLLGDMYEGWARWGATFTDVGLTVRVDEGIDNTWDVTYTSTGTTPVGAFSDLRFGGPSALASTSGGFVVDNVRLEVTQAVPEPSTLAFLALGALAFIARQRASR